MARKTKTKPDIAALMAEDIVTPPASLEEAQSVAREWSETKLRRDKLVVKRDEEIAKINKNYALLVEASDGILDKCYRRLRVFFADPANIDMYMHDRRSTVVSNIQCSLRQSPGKVEILSGQKEADVVQLILDSCKRAHINRYLSMTPKLDKDAIIEDWEDMEKQQYLRNFGILVTKLELFALTDLGREEITNTQRNA